MGKVGATADRRTPRRGPGRPRRGEAADTAARIVEVATGLFAARGFDGVSMREIAGAVGVDVATVQHHAGSKAALYDQVFARMYDAEREAVAAAAQRVRERVEQFPGEILAGLHEILDAFLDFVAMHPEVTALWLRRWLEPEQHRDLDERYSLPLYRLVGDLLTAADRAGLLSEPHPRHAIRSIVWAVHGHVTAAAASGAEASAERAEFRAFMHRMLDGLYARR